MSGMSRLLMLREALGYEVSAFSCGKAQVFSALAKQTIRSKARTSPSPFKGGGVTLFWDKQKRNSALCVPVCGFGGRVGKPPVRPQAAPVGLACGPCAAMWWRSRSRKRVRDLLTHRNRRGPPQNLRDSKQRKGIRILVLKSDCKNMPVNEV